MELNLIDKELSFCINDKNIGPAYTDIDIGDDIKYKMVIDMLYALTKIQLIEFTSNQNKHDDTKSD